MVDSLTETERRPTGYDRTSGDSPEVQRRSQAPSVVVLLTVFSTRMPWLVTFRCRAFG